MLKEIKPTLSKLQTQKPLVLCLTNYVTMDFIANCLLAVGAAPLMSEEDDELDQLLAISNALYINIGTLNHAFINRINKASIIAKQKNIPIVLDPVGAGASRIRTQTAMTLLPKVDIVKGNASEVLALANIAHQTQGVEAVDSVTSAKAHAQTLAKQFNLTVHITGAEDFLCDDKKEKSHDLGCELMARITGMGCCLGAIDAAFAAVESSPLTAAFNASAYFSYCGMQAANKTSAPASFKTAFIDALFLEGQ